MYARLEELQALPFDWDSYGAKTISELALATANALTFTPSPDGGVQIELHAGGSDVEIEIDADGWVKTVMWGRP